MADNGELLSDLRQCVEDDNVEGLIGILEGIDPADVPGDDLLRATRLGRVKVLKTLLEAGVHPDKLGNTENVFVDEMSALGEAAKRGRSDLVNLLLSFGADVSLADGERMSTPLILASANDHTNVVRILLKQGADPDTPNENGTPLMFAIRNRDAYTVDVLLKGGASTEAHPSSLPTPLGVCIQVGFDAGVRRLIREGASLAPFTNSNGTVYYLEEAVSCNREAAVRALLDAGVSVHDTSDGGSLLASSDSLSPNIARMLVEAGADVNGHVAGRRAALHQAVIKGNDNTLDVLIRGGADVDAEAVGVTPLFQAVLRRKQRCAIALLRAGCDPCLPSRTPSGVHVGTPLAKAVALHHDAFAMMVAEYVVEGCGE